MVRSIRVQAAIVDRDHILLVKHREYGNGREYWLLPGGGIEADETETACLVREVQEETHLTVAPDRLLLDEATPDDRVYQRFKTYLCRVITGEAQPGQEPEVELADVYAITEVNWFDLRDERSWDAHVRADRWTYPLLKQIQAALGYAAGP